MIQQFRKTLAALLGAAMLCSGVGALCGSAVVGEVEDDGDDSTFTDEVLTYEIIDGGVRVKTADPGVVELTLPKEVGGYPIIEIGEAAFSGCTSLKQLTLKANLRSIGEGAFTGCTSLTEIKLPDTITSIGEYAFYSCTALETIELPDSLEEIGSYAFSYCFSLKEVDFPDTLKVLPSYLFYYSMALESVDLPDQLEELQSLCFMGCSSLQELEIPATTTTINALALMACSSMKQVKVDADNPNYMATEDGVLFTKDGSELMFYPTGSSAVTYTIPDGTTTLSPYAFSGALSLEEVVFPSSIQVINEGAFSNCVSLKNIEYPAHLDYIAASAFADCVQLTTFAIPESIRSIGEYAFYGCTALTDIQIPAAVEAIGAYAFCDCTALKSLTVPETVTTIEEYAIGFYVPEAEEDAETTPDPEVIADFTMQVKPQSAAKEYAKTNDIDYDQDGIDPQLLLYIGIGVLLVIFVALGVVAWKRFVGKKTAAEQAKSAIPEEDEIDPNYVGILGDDEDGDPFDRSYGFRIDDEEGDDKDSDDDTADDFADDGTDTDNFDCDTDCDCDVDD